MMPTLFPCAAPRLAALGLLLSSACCLQAQPPQAMAVHSLAQTVTSKDAALKGRLAARSAISLAVADFNSDGTSDLVTGYATGSTGALLLQLGDSNALAPTAAQLAKMAAGQPVPPFASTATATDLPVRPDLLKTADLAGHGHVDLVVAAKGDSTVYLLRGEGTGKFAPIQALPLSGAVSALAVWRGPGGTHLLAAAVCNASGCGVQMLDSDGTTAAFLPTSAPVSSLESASLNGGRYQDLLVLTPENVLIFDGASLLSGTAQTATLPISGGAAIASGLFAYDRRGFAQVAVLGSNATLHVFARAGIDSTAVTRADIQTQRRAAAHKLQVPAASPRTLTWSEVETTYGVGAGGPSAMLLRGRFSGGGFDDLAVLSGGQLVTVAHPLVSNDAGLATTSVVTVDASSSEIATAAVAARLTPDARLSVITAAATAVTPSYTIPPIYRTIQVTTMADAIPNTTSETACRNGAPGCTLRAAVAVANSDVSSTRQVQVDRILLPAGTYTLSATNGSTYDSQGSFNYHLDVDSSVSFVGAGAASTFINGNQIDKVFSVDSGVVNSLAPYDVFFSDLTIENGENKNNEASSECAGNCNFYGGNMDYESYGPGTLGFSNVNLTGGTILYGIGQGGGLFVSNSNTSTANGLTEFDHSTISNNKAPNQGGGLCLTQYVPLTLTADTFSGNLASPSVSPSAPEVSSYSGDGGAVWIDSAGNPAINMTGTTFSGNIAKNEGGALWIGGAGPTITGSTFTGNSGGSFGGGAYLQNLTTPVSITASTFTANSLTGSSGQTYSFPSNGAGVCVDTNLAGEEQVAVHYSRFFRNSGGTSTGLGVGCAFSNASGYGFANVNATDNWWGCNGPAVGTGCDTAASRYPTTAILTLTPYTTLTLTLSATFLTEGATITATGSLGQDSSGNVYSAANDLAYDGVPATLTLTDVAATTTSGSTLTPSANPAISYAAITAQGTTNATGTGVATVTVDNASITRNYTITAPDLTVTSTHNGNFKAGDAADTYSLTATNNGNGTTSGTVTVADILPGGFTAHSLSGAGWTCTLSTLTCTRAEALSAGGNYPPITLSVSVSAADVGIYTNTVRVSGGGETNTSNDTGNDPTNVVAAPSIVEAFSPTSIAPGFNATVTFSVGNPGGNPVALTGVAFSDALPTGLKIAVPSGAATTCASGTVTAIGGGASIALSGATIVVGSTCTVTVSVSGSNPGMYTNTTGPVSAANSNGGATASATLTVTQAASDSVLVGAESISFGTASTTLSASIPYSGTAAPTGGFTFTVDGGTAVAGICTGTTSPLTCMASYPTGSLSVGNHTITGTEAADTNYSAVSGAGTLTVTAAPNGTPFLIGSSTQVLETDGSYLVTIVVQNTGSGAAQNVMLAGVNFGSVAGTPDPQPLGTIQPGTSVTATVVLPPSAGAPGTTLVERINGTFTGGSFANTYRASLP